MSRNFTKSNPKTRKGESLGYDTLILHLAPADEAGIGNCCPSSTPGCRASCLNRAGRGAMATIQSARVRRTRALFPDGIAAGPDAKAMRQLDHEIGVAGALAAAHGRKLAIRLNGTSDLPWETYAWQPIGTLHTVKSLMARHPDVQFYDYTKNPIRMQRALLQLDWPANYHLTFSRSDTNSRSIARVLAAGGNVAIVAAASYTRTDAFDASFSHVDGDAHDLTFLHSPGSILWLTPKGPAKQDTTGFVLR